ncbi:hypothetical protein MMON44395_27730 [Mycolicibacterium monacense DSM 44395]|nr:hypothetical protein [Mycolicibacterium monacense DSM 44395]
MRSQVDDGDCSEAFAQMIFSFELIRSSLFA